MSRAKEQFNLRKQSISYAFAGLNVLWASEINFRIHIIASLFVFGLGIILKLHSIEWICLILCIGMVITAEIFNTAIEHICDLTSKEIKPEIKLIKDKSAAAVLFMAVISAVVGCIIFIPKIYQNIFSS